MARKAKPLYEGQMKSAWCDKLNKVKIEDKVIEPAVPAQKERKVTVEKDTQKIMSEFSKPAKTRKVKKQWKTAQT